MRFLLAVAAVSLSLTACVSMTDASDDPNIWLEDVHGEKALAWVSAENEKTLKRLTGDRRYAGYRREALKIFTAKDRIAMPTFRAGGVDSLWQDAKHPHGVWRATTLASYRTGAPRWTTVLDFDALSRVEKRNWFFKGASCLPREERLCLVRLSDGGGDAVEVREFDARTRQFVKGGFQLGRAKQSVEFVDADTILVSRALNDSETTESGYPAVVRELKRGQRIEDARIVFRADRKDTMVSTTVLRNEDGSVAARLAERRVGFFDVELHLIDGPAPVKVGLPTFASLRGFVNGRMIFTVQDKWKNFAQGALVAIDLAGLRKAPDRPELVAELVMQPASSQTMLKSTGAMRKAGRGNASRCPKTPR